MYLHDYMVTHCCFDFSDDSMKYTAYKALVEGTAVCQGYSLAYQDLAERLGMQVEFVVSNELNHGWNLVEINGKHYYVDCTWDDALGTTNEGTRYYWYDQCCLHTYFLKSQDYFDEYHGSNKNHKADDYTIYTENGPVKIRGYYNNKEYAILVRTKDFQTNFKSELVYTDKHGYEFLENSNLFGGELILPNIGASIGKVFIVPKLDYRMTLAPNTIMIRFVEDYQRDWVYILFLSKFGKNLLYDISSSTAQGKFNKTDFKELVIPVPPLAEQKRIVAKIEEVFKEIDKLKNNG
jgi:hypothetical protein